MNTDLPENSTPMMNLDLRFWQSDAQLCPPVADTLDSGLRAGMSSIEPVRQSVLNTLSVARPEVGLMKETTDWEPVALPVRSTTMDGRLREGNTYPAHSALGVSLDSGLMEGNTQSVARPDGGSRKEFAN